MQFLNSTKNIVSGLIVLCILYLVFILSLSNHFSISEPKEIDPNLVIKNVAILDSTSTEYTIEEKINALRFLKNHSTDEKVNKVVRVKSGEKVVDSFFNNGTVLSKGFTKSDNFNEREVYEYAKYIDSLGGTGRNSLLIAYIGLRFYDNEETKESISKLLRSFQEYTSKNGDTNACGNGSKFASVIYLSQKSKHADVSNEFGDYYTNFERVYNSQCSEDKRVMVAFMWLAAISDIGNSEKENQKAKELLSVVTRDSSEKSRLVRNLKLSYFSQVKEPDTVSIVERLVAKYPEFKVFIENLNNK